MDSDKNSTPSTEPTSPVVETGSTPPLSMGVCAAGLFFTWLVFVYVLSSPVEVTMGLASLGLAYMSYLHHKAGTQFFVKPGVLAFIGFLDGIWMVYYGASGYSSAANNAVDALNELSNSLGNLGF